MLTGREAGYCAAMQPPRWLATAVVVALALLTLPALADAAEPPNQNDRCSAAGRNTCGTTGVGQYDTYRYGLRWFGDYRGAVPGEALTFCIDLRFWYPNAAYRYRAAREPGPAQPRRRGRLDGAPAADGLRDVDLRAQREPAPAGRGHAVRARADGRRRARRGRPRRRSARTSSRSTTASHATRPATTAPTGIEDRPAGEAHGGAAGDGRAIRVLSASGRAVPNLRADADGGRASRACPTS